MPFLSLAMSSSCSKLPPGSARLQLDFKNVYPFPDDEPLQRLCRLIEPIADRVLVSSGADWQLRKLRQLAPWLMLGFDVMYYIDWEPAAAERDANDLPRTLGAYGYYDDHFLAAGRTWHSTAGYLRDRCESLLLAVPDVRRTVSALHADRPVAGRRLQLGGVLPRPRRPA